MVSTRAQCRAQFHQRLSNFPDELWLEVLSHLPAKDLGRAVCLCRKFSSLKDNAWQYACEKRWPKWSQIARAPDTQWRRQYELFELRDREKDAISHVPAIAKLQTVVNAVHRTVLTEWLAEVRAANRTHALASLFEGLVSHTRRFQVAWEWNLESTTVFKAVNYLDHYLGTHHVDALKR